MINMDRFSPSEHTNRFSDRLYVDLKVFSKHRWHYLSNCLVYDFLSDFNDGESYFGLSHGLCQMTARCNSWLLGRNVCGLVS